MIKDRIIALQSSMPAGARLLAVSKFHPVEALQEAYDAGQRLFGESRVQELLQKKDQLPADIEWHFIGHLQTNKVKQLVPFVTLIHGVDTEHLLQEIDKQAAACGRVVDCLLEVHVAREETKFGFSPDDVLAFFSTESYKKYPNVRVLGIMGMASHVDDNEAIRAEFKILHALYEEVKAKHAPWFKELSMGMSSDYPIALEEGSTMVRVGTYIFGSRY